MFTRVEKSSSWKGFLTTSEIVKNDHKAILQAVLEVGQN
jgi:hypothetical protein